MKFVLLTVIAVVFAGSAQSQQWQRQWQVSGHPSLELSVRGVNLVVETGPSNSIEAVLESDGWSIGKLPVGIDEHQAGDVVKLQVEAKAFIGIRFLRLRILVPRDFEADVQSASGSIELYGLHGRLRLVTKAGGIHATDMDGSVDAATGSGSIRVQGRFDGLNLRTHSGAIAAEVLPGSRLLGDWMIESEYGPEAIKVSSSFAAEIEAHSASGRIRSELPLVTHGFQSKNLIQGKFNGGGPEFKISSQSGSILLTSL